MNPIAGAAYNGIDAFGSTYENARAHGASDHDAAVAGFINGGVNAVIGALPAPGIRMLSAPTERVASPIVAAALRTAAAGGTNATYGATSQLASNTVARSTYNPHQDLLDGVPQAAATAGVFGTLSRGALEAGSAGVNAFNAWRTDASPPDSLEANQIPDDQGPEPRGPDPSNRRYPVAYSVQLDPSDYGRSRQVHYNRANRALHFDLQFDRDWAAKMEEMIPGLQDSVSAVDGRTTPEDWRWHHAFDDGLMEFMPKHQHTPGSIHWDEMPPDGRGGYSRWAIPAGALPNK